MTDIAIIYDITGVGNVRFFTYNLSQIIIGHFSKESLQIMIEDFKNTPRNDKYGEKVVYADSAGENEPITPNQYYTQAYFRN
jgi:hypothetical protein